MKRMPDEFIDLTVTSPPYDNLRTYKGYVFPFEDIAKELYRVTKQGGVIVWVVSDATINGSETGTSFKQALFFMECGFCLYDTMIWIKNQLQFPTKNKYHNAFEYMFVFSKGKPKSINLIADKENVSFGRNPRKRTERQKNGDLKDVPKAKRYKQYGIRWNYWLIYNQNRGEHLKHPATFPEQLAADHIYSWSNEGDLVYDPFGGSGTTAKMAHQLNRNWVLSEISSEYCEIAQKRISAHTAQTKMF